MVKTHKKTPQHHAKHKAHKKTEAHSHGDSATHAHKHSAKKSHSAPSTPTPADRMMMWKTLSVVAVLLLVASVLTGGFSGGGTDPTLAEDITTTLQNEGIITQSEAQSTQDAIQNLLQPQPEEEEKEPAPSQPVADGDGLSVELYVMSQCPYGTQAEDAMFAAIDDIGEQYFNLQVDYIADGNAESGFTSLHGQPEVDGNIAQLCGGDVEPEKFTDLVLCMNEDADNIPDNWRSCAQELDMDVSAIQECIDGDRGAELHEASLQRAKERQATGSPTIYIDGSRYSGSREVLDFKRAFCNAFDSDTRPDTCSDVPEPTQFTMTIVNTDCPSCDTQNVVGATQQFFPGVEIEEVDLDSAKGQELVSKYDLSVVPSYLFEEKVTETQAWEDPNFQQSFEELDDGSYKLIDQATGATYFVDEEKRAEQERELEQYSQSNLEAVGYTGDKPRLDYYVMAFCPYGNPADEAAGKIYDLLGDSVVIEPHYIVSTNGDSIESLHGEAEGNQGVRELCALEELGYEAYFDFTLATNELCSSENADTCWTQAAEQAGVSVDAIQSCYDENRIAYASEQEELIDSTRTMRNGQLTPPTASPTFFINGETYESGRDAESIKTALCQEFDDANRPSECDETIEVEQTAATQQPTAQC